jgi:hypothetical protein
MSFDHHITSASVEAVWNVLSQPLLYADFVVGSKFIRNYDADWPAVDTRLHHTLGIGPLALKDESTVIEVEPRRHLRLHTGLRPFGVNVVVFRLEPLDGDRTRVTIEEDRLEGPLRFVPRLLADPALSLRNKALLRRLSRLAEAPLPAHDEQPGPTTD